MTLDPTAFARQAERASRVCALLLPAAACAGLARGSLLPLAVLGPSALAALVLQLYAFSARTVLPNLLTALRVVLTAGLAAWELTPRSAALLVLLVFALDGLDGHTARRLQACSPQGAHFDMEADAYLMLTLCARLAHGGVTPWVLLGGLLRYLYVLALWLLPARGEQPRSRFGRYAFAGSLCALTLALVAGAYAPALATLGNGILIWSFGRSFVWAFSVTREAAR